MLRDVSSAPNGGRFYGGLACPKLSLLVDGKPQILKFPNVLKGKGFKNTNLSYANSSISELIGSEIFKLFGLPVHKVQLVLYDNKLCAMCEDFVTSGRLVEFREIISTSGLFTDSGVTGSTTDLDCVLAVAETIPGYTDFFWKMFVVDAIIGNHDRNTGNFGIISSNGTIRIAPVYDNGNCLNPTWDIDKMIKHLSDIDTVAYKAYTCKFTLNDKEINPFQLLEKNIYSGATKALRMLDGVTFSQIEEIVNNTPEISSEQKDYYNSVMFSRFIKLLTIKNQLLGY